MVTILPGIAESRTHPFSLNGICSYTRLLDGRRRVAAIEETMSGDGSNHQKWRSRGGWRDFALINKPQLGEKLPPRLHGRYRYGGRSY